MFVYIGDDIRFAAIVIVIFSDKTQTNAITFVSICRETGKMLYLQGIHFFALFILLLRSIAQIYIVLLGYRKKSLICALRFWISPLILICFYKYLKV